LHRSHPNRLPVRALLLAVAAALAAPQLAPAQSANGNPTVEATGPAAAPVFDRAAWRIGPYVGRAAQSPVTERLGTTPGRTHLFVGVQAATPVLQLGRLDISYVAQVLPLVRFQGRTAPIGYGGLTSDDGLLLSQDVAYAVGISPFGIEMASPRTSRVAFFAATSAGGLYFRDPYPIPESGRFNFTLEYGAGTLIRVADARWIRAGYKYHHLSNAYTAQQNPGVDGNVWYAGFEWGLSLPRSR
jgi:hypothetical protein